MRINLKNLEEAGYVIESDDEGLTIRPAHGSTGLYDAALRLLKDNEPYLTKRDREELCDLFAERVERKQIWNVAVGD